MVVMKVIKWLQLIDLGYINGQNLASIYADEFQQISPLTVAPLSSMDWYASLEHFLVRGRGPNLDHSIWMFSWALRTMLGVLLTRFFFIVYTLASTTTMLKPAPPPVPHFIRSFPDELTPLSSNGIFLFRLQIVYDPDPRRTHFPLLKRTPLIFL